MAVLKKRRWNAFLFFFLVYFACYRGFLDFLLCVWTSNRDWMLMVNAWVTLLYLLRFWGDNGKLSEINNPKSDQDRAKQARTSETDLDQIFPNSTQLMHPGFGAVGAHLRATPIRKMKCIGRLSFLPVCAPIYFLTDSFDW